jgi:predicted transcriptional regulator
MATLTTGGLVKTSITVDPAQLARLERIVRERHVSKSYILRVAIEAALVRLEAGEDFLEPERVA